jgi:hypothetical protein
MHLSADELKAHFVQSFPRGSGELAYELRNGIIYLHLKWKLYRALFGTSQERIDLLNQAAPAFFGHLEPIMRHNIILTITRLTDPARTGKHQNASLGRLIEQLAAHADATKLGGWNVGLATLQTAVEPMRAMRNQFLAHEDLATALNHHFQPSPSRADTEAVLRNIRDLFGSIEERFCGSCASYDLIIADGGEQLITSLQRALTHKDCERAEFKSKYGAIWERSSWK